MKQSKNFIFLSNATGGIATFQSNLINYLSSKKIKTILIDKKKYNQTEKKIFKKKNHKLYVCNVLKNFSQTIKILSKISKKNKDKNIFVISNTIIFTIYFFYFKFFVKNSKIILIYHSHLYDINFIQILFGFTSSFLSLFNHKTIFVSNYTKNWWNKYFPLTIFSKNYVLNNFIQLPTKIKNKKIKKLNIGFVGRFEKEKGINKFIDTAVRIKDNKINFFIFGEGSIKINKNYKKIKFYKWTKLKNIFSKINLLFVTSKIENCPLNVIEAKSNGIPTISISDGGIHEIVENNKDGILLNQNSDINEIYKSFSKILKNYKFYSKNCIKNSKKFNIDNYNFFLK